ncbi:MAG: hypothetical protein DGJ47_000452 [Rickettsiaceae bacterium]
MNKTIIFAVFLCLWFCLVGINTTSIQSLVFAFVVATASVIITFKLNILPAKRRLYILGSIIYLMWLAKEVIVSAFEVSKIAWKKSLGIRPELKTIKSEQDSDLGVVVYANSITITPGTVTISNEGKNLLVHALDISFGDELEKGEMDKKITKIVRPS